MFGFGKRPANPPEQAPQPAPQAPAPDTQQQAPQQPAVQQEPQEPAPAPENTGFFGRLMAGLSRTRETLSEGLGTLLLGKKAIDQNLLDELETRLLTADVGIKATNAILEELTARIKRKELADSDALYAALKQILRTMLKPIEVPLQVTNIGGKPFVILMVGVNGVGKTTTIGKLAKRFQQEGRSVVLAAGDTFRAAAVEQLQAWGERNKVPVVAQHTGADSASVIFDAYQSACARGVDVLIADTAGRLQNKANLMQELEKVVRVLKKLDPDVPHEVLLVLDATTGQNALSQARSFQEAVKVSGLVLSKLDGTAKGGMVFAIAQELGLPLRFIGIGEKAEDLRPFAAEPFVDALFDARQS
ncbi:MAG: signal recognition particle-docking protein FtsY [Gammaproteobacteria bacterium]